MAGTLAGCSGGPRPVSHHKEPALSASDQSDDKQTERDYDRIERHGDAPASITWSEWQYVGFDGVKFTTPHYRIYTTARRSDFLDRLPIFFEAALDHYATYFCQLPRPSEPMETYLFQDRRQWQVKTQELLPRQAEAFSMLGRGGFATQGIAVLYYIDRSSRTGSHDTFAIAAHEGWHQYTQSTFQQPLPIWLEEGIATYMESLRVDHAGNTRFRPWTNRERWRTLARARHNNQLIPLDELLERTPQQFLETGRNPLLVYYAQVWALTRFIAEGADGKYRAALEEVLMDAAEGRMIERVMRATGMSMSRRHTASQLTRNGPFVLTTYFTDDLESFEREYLEYIQRLTQSRH